jgi:hypothetical protein
VGVGVEGGKQGHVVKAASVLSNNSESETALADQMMTTNKVAVSASAPAIGLSGIRGNEREEPSRGNTDFKAGSSPTVDDEAEYEDDFGYEDEFESET